MRILLVMIALALSACGHAPDGSCTGTYNPRYVKAIRECLSTPNCRVGSSELVVLAIYNRNCPEHPL